jgi:hypothetical protein
MVELVDRGTEEIVHTPLLREVTCAHDDMSPKSTGTLSCLLQIVSLASPEG